MKIGSNIFALKATNRLDQTSRAIARSLERLSTGSRLSRPQDDVVSFSIATKLDAQIRGLRQSALNINKAEGLVQTAASALSQQREIIAKMRELALSASNGFFSSVDLEKINQEMQSLLEGFRAITQQTEFNGLHLLDGSTDVIEVALGANAEARVQIPGFNNDLNQIFQKSVGTAKFTQSESLGTLISGNIEKADLNNDGLEDLVHVDAINEDVFVLLNNGDGSFDEQATFTVADGINVQNSIALVDVDGDGLADMVLGNDGSFVSVYLGDGSGGFSLDSSFATDSEAETIQLADLDNDGTQDIFFNYGIGFTEYRASYLNDGEGSFSLAETASTGVEQLDDGLFDINGDGYLDAATNNLGDPRWYLGNGDGTFSTTACSETVVNNGGSFLFADLDGDEDLDLVIADNTNFGTPDYVTVKLNNGDGSFGSAMTFETQNNDILHPVLGDFDSDGDLDLVVSDNTGLLLYLNDGAGGFSLDSTFEDGGATQRTLAIDINGDGVDDFITSNNSPKEILGFITMTKQETAAADLRVDSIEAAESLISVLDRAALAIESQQAELAAIHSVLEIESSRSLLLSETLEDSKSQISDVDYSLEIADLLRQQILAEAQIAVLAQANINLQMIQELLP